MKLDSPISANYAVEGYYPTIGIECHVQLNTVTKLFTGIDNDARGKEPNTTVGPLCLGLPGTLPVLNQQAVDKAIIAGLALDARIATFTKFDRKHYFYPDLPLGYQISQFDEPIVLDGSFQVQAETGPITVRIERAHLEADAGKLFHPAGQEYSLVDLNRAGTPLLEIVSRPDMHSPLEAKAYAKELYQRMLHAGVSDCDLYHGNIRFDVNVSVSKDPSILGTRTETKNLNSFKNIERAVIYEIERQIGLLESGEAIVQETRGWDDTKQRTTSQRSKEDAHDYRYMPDPDIPPLTITAEYVAALASAMPIKASVIRDRLLACGLKTMQIDTMLDHPLPSRFLYELCDRVDESTVRTLTNWLVGPLLQLQDGNDAVNWQVYIDNESELIKLASMVDSNMLSSTAAKEILIRIAVSGEDPETVAAELNLLQVSDESELIILVQKVLADNPKAHADAQADPKASGFLIGQVMKASQGQANPQVVARLLQDLL